MSQEKILERVRKLLELAKSDNPHEVGNAAAQAQKLMTEHAIEEAMLGTVSAEEEIETDILNAVEGTQCATWRSYLSSTVCRVNNATSYIHGSALYIIGRPSDAAKARYLFAHVQGEINRLCKLAAAERGEPGRTWCNNFRLGATNAVRERLDEAHKAAIAGMRKAADAGDTLGNGTALVRVDNALAKLQGVQEQARAKLKDMKLKRGPKPKFRADTTARAVGFKAGQRIDIAPGGKGALGAGARSRLGS